MQLIFVAHLPLNGVDFLTDKNLDRHSLVAVVVVGAAVVAGAVGRK